MQFCIIVENATNSLEHILKIITKWQQTQMSPDLINKQTKTHVYK